MLTSALDIILCLCGLGIHKDCMNCYFQQKKILIRKIEFQESSSSKNTQINFLGRTLSEECKFLLTNFSNLSFSTSHRKIMC